MEEYKILLFHMIIEIAQCFLTVELK
jgi:hypothetical protein